MAQTSYIPRHKNPLTMLKPFSYL